jgi:hypothetical protein
VVLACAMTEMPDATVHLVERNAKKAAFLREALRVTNARGTVHLSDIGDSVDRIVGQVDCVTARAVAPLHQLIGFAAPLVSQGAKALFLKGQDECWVIETTKYWNIKADLVPAAADRPDRRELTRSAAQSVHETHSTSARPSDMFAPGIAPHRASRILALRTKGAVLARTTTDNLGLRSPPSANVC